MKIYKKSLFFQICLSYIALLFLVVSALLLSIAYFNVRCNQTSGADKTIHFKIELNVQHKTFEITDASGNSLVKLLLESALLFIVLCILEILALGTWVKYKVKRPLDAITKGLMQMQSGDYQISLDFDGVSDFEVLKNKFNEMIATLNQSIQEKEVLQQTQKTLLLNLSHDIRTPIASIKAYASALNDGLVEEDKKRRYYNTILLKSQRIAELTDQMFDLLKLENNTYSLNMTKRNLCEVLRESILEYYEEIEEKGFEIEVDLPEKDILVMMDEKYFRRLIGNLLLNALKYNEEGTRLCIRVEEKGGLKIIISDNGKGIPEKIQNEIFNPFVRGDESRNSNGGTGLGLAIVKMIVQKHGWQIEYEACNPGSRFTIYII